MDQESFESLIRAKLEGKGQKAPSGIWTGISGSLNDHAISILQSSQKRYRWIAVAAILLAFLSFAANLTYFKVTPTQTSSNSFNALLPTEAGHFRFFEPQMQSPQEGDYQSAWTNILFLERENSSPSETPAAIYEDVRVVAFLETHEVGGIRPEIGKASLTFDFNPYYVAQYRSTGKSSSTRSTFWAGIEAGAGNFDPTFDGTDPIATNVDFDALARNIGQDGFANPSTSALQNGMNEGIVTTLGLDFGIKMGQRWTLESGLQYANVQNQASATVNVSDIYTISSERIFSSQGDLNNPVIAPSARQTEIEENFEHSVDLENNFKFTSIPLKAGYFILDNKLSLRLNAGFSANFLVGNRITDPSGQLESYDQSDAYNAWSFDGLTGFELGYSLFENVNLTFEPNYRQSITPLSNSLSTRSGFMVQTGLRYTIK